MKKFYITYHRKVSPNGKEFAMSADVLNEQVKDYLLEHGVSQSVYQCWDNGTYFFIYLNNGDRVDVLL